MFDIVQHPPNPSTLAQYQQVLRALRTADLSDPEANQYWDQAAAALELPTVPLQHKQLNRIFAGIHLLTHMEAHLCSK